VTAADGAGLDQLLAQARQALAAVRSGDAAGGTEPVEGVGTARDEQIRAVVRAPGRVTGLEINPRLLRLPSAELAEEITAAVNTALADLQARTSQATAAPADVAALQGQLEELQADSVRQLQGFLSGLDAAVQQIRARKG
jgi:hypothetical protein